MNAQCCQILAWTTYIFQTVKECHQYSQMWRLILTVLQLRVNFMIEIRKINCQALKYYFLTCLILKAFLVSAWPLVAALAVRMLLAVEVSLRRMSITVTPASARAAAGKNLR